MVSLIDSSMVLTMTLVTDSGKFARSVTHFLKLKIPKKLEMH